MGSTPNRVQISDLEEKNICGENILLKNKFMQLFDSNGHMCGTRVAVASYDSTYGHVYPQTGSVAPNNLLAAAQCFFYKLSNNPEYIEVADQVRCATTSSDSSLVMSGLKTIDGVATQNGDLVLVKDYTGDNAKKNGIYRVNSETTWTRSGSYQDWASFIGKVFYIQEGTVNGGKNFMSQAQVGGTLYNESTVPGQSGDSRLYFSIEQPILLFPEKLTEYVDFYKSTDPSSDTEIDGYSGFSSGATCLAPSGVFRFDAENNV